MLHALRTVCLSSILLGLLFPATTLAAEDPEPRVDPELFSALEFRLIGPYRGGRVTAVTGVRGMAGTFYMGSTGGGVWKTTDSGETWASVSGEGFESASIGALAVAPSDPNVIYAGTGSACPRGNVSPGDGVYRSTDAGESWSHAGLPEAGQIGRIRVQPQNPDVVWVAALGHIFGPNPERGVFRSRDGGQSWEKVLFVSDRAGAVDLALDPANPRILFAATWEVERKPWTLASGGEGSALWRSKDGGDTWEKLEKGLPEGPLGRIGVAVSGAKPGRVWALVEAGEGGLFRSDDGGESFRRVNADRNFRQRAWYYTHVYADPRDAETVWVLNVGLWRSTDGGADFEYLRAPHGDHHDLWIDPDDPQVMINGNDGGANVTTNGGASWSTQANQPTAEMYRVTVDDQFPYRVYGCQQDNSCVSLPSRTASSGITRQHWWVIGGCESGHVAVDPRDPEVTYAGCYGGSISRHDHATGQDREITAYPQLAVGQAARDLRYRFQWNAPIRLSPHDPSVLYHASQFVHRSTDEGRSWEVISPDLSRDDEARQDYAGGPVTRDNTGVEVYGTVFAFEESPHVRGLLWAGTDDGRVHLSRDAGASWSEITPKKMPELGQVNSLELSAHDPGRAFLAVTRYKFDDFAPYVFRTDDYGARWTLLTDGANGIPPRHFVRVVREDPTRRGLLYAGTEFGLYVSFDDGESWQSLQLDLPVSPVTDLAVQGSDLVVATQGRSFWILDDLGPLRELRDAIEAEGAPGRRILRGEDGATALLYELRDVHRFGGGLSFGRGGPAGENPPGGAMIHYVLFAEPEAEAEIVIEILDAEENVLRTFSSLTDEPAAPNPWARFIPALAERPRKLPAEKGMNRWVWDLRLPDAGLVEDAVLWGVARGPKVPPGRYRVRMTYGAWSQSRDFEVLADPRLEVAQEELEEQYELAREVWSALTESHRALKRLRDVRTQATELGERLAAAGQGEEAKEAAAALAEKLAALEDAVHQTKAESSQDVLNYPPKLDNQLLSLQGVVESADAAPTAGARQRYEDLRAELDALLADLQAVIDTDVAAFNQLVTTKNVGAVIDPGG